MKRWNLKAIMMLAGLIFIRAGSPLLAIPQGSDFPYTGVQDGISEPRYIEKPQKGDNPNIPPPKRRAGQSEAAYEASCRAYASASQRKQLAELAESRLKQQAGESDTDYQARLRMTIKAVFSLNALSEKREGQSEKAYRACCRALNRSIWVKYSPLIAQPGENEKDYQERIHASKVAKDRLKHTTPPIKRAGQSEAAYQAALRAYRARQAKQARAGSQGVDQLAPKPTRHPGQSEREYQGLLRAWRAKRSKTGPNRIRVHTEHVSLTGKPLPKLKDLRIELPADTTTDKMILLCFLDMQQRPSRNCRLQLIKRAQDLKRKGVAVCVVQASAIDQDALDEWVKKNSIPFPAGMIGGGKEEILRKWGVKSMPWLVLTDCNHVVSAEGFGLSELSDKLGQIRENKNNSVEDLPDAGIQQTEDDATPTSIELVEQENESRALWVSRDEVNELPQGLGQSD